MARGAVKYVAPPLQKPRLPTPHRQHSPPQLMASAEGAGPFAASAGQLALPRSASEWLAWAAVVAVAAWLPASSVPVVVPALKVLFPVGAGSFAASAGQLALPRSASERLAWAAAAAATVASWKPASSALVVVLVPASRASWPGGAGPSAVFAEQLASPGSASEQLAWAAAAAVAAWVPASVPAVRPWTSAIVPGRWRGGEYELRKRRGVACVGMQECRRAWVPWNRRESWPAWPSSRLKPWAGRRERTPGNCRGRGAASVPQACGMIAVQPCRSLRRLAS